MSRGQADKLIRMWPIAQALFESMDSESNDPTRIRVIRLNQAVIWELVPVAEGYDLEAATAVYKTTVEADEGPMTAEVVKGVVKGVTKTLTKGQEIDQEALTSAVRAALAQVAAKKEAGPKKPQAAPKPKISPVPALPWDSPDALNRILRQHMSEENRRTLGKILISD